MKNIVLSVVTIARNEQEDLPAFLATYGTFADEIVVLDDWSTDGTRAILEDPRTKGMGIPLRVRSSERSGIRPEDGFAVKRNAAAAYATGEWLLHVDVDMLPTPEFVREVRQLTNTVSGGYAMIKRVDYLMGVRLDAAESSRWTKPWLVAAGEGEFRGVVHEDWVPFAGSRLVGEVKSPILHLGDANFVERIRKNVHYTELGLQGDPHYRPGLVRCILRAARSSVAVIVAPSGMRPFGLRLFWATYMFAGTLLRELAFASRSMSIDRERMLADIVAEMRVEGEYRSLMNSREAD